MKNKNGKNKNNNPGQQNDQFDAEELLREAREELDKIQTYDEDMRVMQESNLVLREDHHRSLVDLNLRFQESYQNIRDHLVEKIGAKSEKRQFELEEKVQVPSSVWNLWGLVGPNEKTIVKKVERTYEPKPGQQDVSDLQNLIDSYVGVLQEQSDGLKSTISGIDGCLADIRTSKEDYIVEHQQGLAGFQKLEGEEQKATRLLDGLNKALGELRKDDPKSAECEITRDRMQARLREVQYDLLITKNQVALKKKYKQVLRVYEDILGEARQSCRLMADYVDLVTRGIKDMNITVDYVAETCKLVSGSIKTLNNAYGSLSTLSNYLHSANGIMGMVNQSGPARDCFSIKGIKDSMKRRRIELKKDLDYAKLQIRRSEKPAK